MPNNSRERITNHTLILISARLTSDCNCSRTATEEHKHDRRNMKVETQIMLAALQSGLEYEYRSADVTWAHVQELGLEFLLSPCIGYNHNTTCHIKKVLVRVHAPRISTKEDLYIPIMTDNTWTYATTSQMLEGLPRVVLQTRTLTAKLSAM